MDKVLKKQEYKVKRKESKQKTNYQATNNRDDVGGKIIKPLNYDCALGCDI